MDENEIVNIDYLQSDFNSTISDSQLNNKIINLNDFDPVLTNKIKLINEDFILLGYYGVYDFIDGNVCFNLSKLISISSNIICSHREKIKLLDELEDKKRSLNIETNRLEKLYGKKLNELELVNNENSRLKDNIKESEKKVKDLTKQIKMAQNNIRNLKSTIDREKNQMQNSKYKLEKEMDSLKERMNKLLSDPKKQYSYIDLNTVVDKRPQSAISQRTISPENNFDNDHLSEIRNNFRTQIEDLLVENRQLRELLIIQLTQMKQLSVSISITPVALEGIHRQRNNSGSSVNSSDSDFSIRSNETFVVPSTVPPVDERVYLELQFEIVKDDIRQLFQNYCQKIENFIKSNVLSQKNNSTLNISTVSTCHDDSSSTCFENTARLQKEIFQLRKRLTDYEEIIQSKDSLLETAIQQRVRRGSLIAD